MEVHTIADSYDVTQLRASVLAEIESVIGSVSNSIILEPAVTAHHKAQPGCKHHIL